MRTFPYTEFGKGQILANNIRNFTNKKTWRNCYAITSQRARSATDVLNGCMEVMHYLSDNG
ncbi:hypothetical protein [Aquicella lusitana]|uniref:hypothetical protein n=1 Tax=Aquicella lusitana TaxID=254246 RepID=UPI0011C042D1|nr:hypothetical protein [Aquicella lusitana]